MPHGRVLLFYYKAEVGGMAQISDGTFFEQISEAFKANDSEIETKRREAAHVRVIQLLFHAIARGAFEESLELMTDDFQLEIFGPPHLPFNGVWQGKEVVLQAMKENFSQVEDQRPAVESVVAQGDVVIITAREIGRVRKTGTQYDVRWMQEYTFSDGKMTRVRELIDGSADFAA